MKITYRTDARNCPATGSIEIESTELFRNYPATEVAAFLASLEALPGKWVRVPENLVDPTTRQNFFVYAKV